MEFDHINVFTRVTVVKHSSNSYSFTQLLLIWGTTKYIQSFNFYVIITLDNISVELLFSSKTKQKTLPLRNILIKWYLVWVCFVLIWITTIKIKEILMSLKKAKSFISNICNVHIFWLLCGQKDDTRTSIGVSFPLRHDYLWFIYAD